LKDVEDALQRLDKLTQEEARMAAAEVLTVTRGIDDKVNDVDERLEGVDEGVQGIGIKVDGIEDQMQIVDGRVKIVDQKVSSVSQGEFILPGPRIVPQPLTPV
jgi:archaellum component FlaC